MGGLEVIEGSSHIILITYPRKVANKQKKVSKVKRRRLVRHGLRLEELPEVGVFCADSSHRPMPTRLTMARLVKHEGLSSMKEGYHTWKT